MKFIHFTDTHLVAPGEKIYGLDPLARLDACIAWINAEQADSEFCVITGDLADRGEAAAYDALRGSLARLSIPYYLLVGNHDDRGRYLEYFPEAVCDDDDFVQSTISTTAGEFILLDTAVEGTSAGGYCERRLAWLSARLQTAAPRPVYLFMHHPPFDIGIPGLDEISLRTPEPLAALLAGYDNIRHLFFGHVHRPVTGSWRGIPFSTLRSTNHQVALQFSAEPHTYWDEPPSCSVVFLEPDRTVIHTHDYLHPPRYIHYDDS